MTYNNKYNALDKIIASFRSKEINKNINLKDKKYLILDVDLILMNLKIDDINSMYV